MPTLCQKERIIYGKNEKEKVNEVHEKTGNFDIYAFYGTSCISICLG